MLTTRTMSPTSTLCLIFFSSARTMHSSSADLPSSGETLTVTKLALELTTCSTQRSLARLLQPCSAADRRNLQHSASPDRQAQWQRGRLCSLAQAGVGQGLCLPAQRGSARQAEPPSHSGLVPGQPLRAW